MKQTQFFIFFHFPAIDLAMALHYQIPEMEHLPTGVLKHVFSSFRFWILWIFMFCLVAGWASNLSKMDQTGKPSIIIIIIRSTYLYHHAVSLYLTCPVNFARRNSKIEASTEPFKAYSPSQVVLKSWSLLVRHETSSQGTLPNTNMAIENVHVQ